MTESENAVSVRLLGGEFKAVLQMVYQRKEEDCLFGISLHKNVKK